MIRSGFGVNCQAVVCWQLRLLLLNGDWALLDRLRMVSMLTTYRRPPAVDLRLAMRHARVMPRHSAVKVPADLRARLEAARLDLLALFRALDRMDLTPYEIPQRLMRQLFELDADYAEALWALDQAPGALDVKSSSAICWPLWNGYRRPLRDSRRIFLRALTLA